jgi:hypothetical protein
MVRYLLASLLLVGSALGTLGVQAQEPDWDAIAAVEQALEEDMSAGAIISMLEERGYSLAEATRISIGATVGEDQLDFAREGICAAKDVREAREVAGAASSVAEEDAQDDIQGFVQRYVGGGCSDAERNRPSRYLPSGSAPDAGDLIGPSSPSS